MAKLGIDLGTSNSATAAVFDMDKRNPVTIEPSEGPYQGDLAFPSYVAFNKKGEYSAAGRPARERFLEPGGSDLVVRYFKRLIGRNYDYVMGQILQDNRAFSEFKGRIKRATDGSILITVGERDISIEEVASHLLRKIIDDAQILIQNRGEHIDSVTISFPAGFEDSQRQATIRAARMAGLEGVDIQAIEEPTAAAIAKGMADVEGSIMVVDVGAGTTDVIIGHMEARADGLQLIMTSRECDDVLGGIDMDNLILEYVFEKDTGSPKLKDIFDGLATDMRLRLMGKIEEAKIIASRDGASAISIGLSAGAAGFKRVNVSLDEATLSKIAAPMIDGYVTGNNYPKGVRPVIERALLKAAGGNQAAVPKVIEEIQWLILVGGPCRMKALHQMLREVFKNNRTLMVQVNHINPLDGFFKEGVARGAALSQAKGIEVSTAVPYTISILHQSGKTPVIAACTPYNRVNGIIRSVMIPMHPGTNLIRILSQKENLPAREWTLEGHLVNVPQEGNLTVNLKWGEGGTEAENMSVEGCGLPRIAFPPKSNETTVGTEMDDRYKWYFGVAKDLRKLVDLARDPLVRLLIPRAGSATAAERMADEMLRVSEADLCQSEKIDVEGEYHLTDQELELAMKTDYFEMRKQVAIQRGLLSPEATEVLDRALSIVGPQSSANTEQLISEANKVLSSSQNCSQCIQYWQQLTQWLHQLQLARDDHSIASATATSMGALADCLYKEKTIAEEEFSHIQGVCWSFHRDL